MCGIAGMICRSGCRLDERVLSEMTEALHHRGPDDGGTHILRHSDLQIGLGHRRLSIIDLSAAGHQPMTNEDGTLWITYNGEVYNFGEIREELIGHGHIFASQSDTEVILHGYEQYGVGVLEKLNGMFAFALWDDRKRQLLLARDRYGKKPLYYHCSNKGLIFASELKSILKNPEVTKEIDIRSLSRYLLHEYVPVPYSLIRGVAKMPPGHYGLWTEVSSLSISPYWQIRFDGTHRDFPREEDELERQLIGLLKKAVERRLVSDVPLGVFLSGGVDSSSIVALMAELMPADRIKTFSIGFEETSFDESLYAKRVAGLFGTDHREKVFTPAMMLETLPQVWDFLDEPLADASILPTYMLAKFTREFVTVALGGDGGDEIFAGYDPFLAHRVAGIYQAVPAWVRDGLLNPLFRALPVSTKNMSFDFRIKQFLKGLPHPLAVRNQVWLGSFDRDEQKRLFKPDCLSLLAGDDPYKDIEESYRGMTFRDDLDQIIYLYSRYYLGEDILTKVDRASMATSLEVRAPYLDVEFAEYVNDLPSIYKLRGLTRKYLLKKGLERILPKDILHRKKKGFGIPLAKWLKGELKPMLMDVFSPAKISREGLFNGEVVQTLLREHFTGQKDNRKPIWTLLMFEMWKQRFSVSG
jgi:asparagine synthase (glutamine-hydrolysing)